MPFRFIFLSVVTLFVTPKIWSQGECHYSLKGYVREAHNDAPIAYASVQIKELDSGVLTDNNGFFTIENLCRSTYQLEISHIDCLPHTETLSVEGNTEGVFFLKHGDRVLDRIEVRAKKIAIEATQANAQISAAELNAQSGKTLGEALKTLAGVTTFNVGSTISKPVVQGLHSDRILIIANGVRYEGQQWGQDHAPEIDPFIAERVTVVKGAAGVKYGVGALGGVIILEPKPLRDTLGIGGAAQIVAFSNGRGGVISSYLEGKNARFAWRAQATAKRSGNLNTPDYFLQNTGVEELNGSLSAGFKLKNTDFDIFYSHFYSKIGILSQSHIGNLTDLRDAFERRNPLSISAFSYAINRPAQRVNHDMAKVKITTPTGEAGTLTTTTFFQHNLREEFDAHRPFGRPPAGFDRSDIAFQLFTTGLKSEWTHQNWQNWHGGGGIEGLFQSNNTFAGALIPDFRQTTIGAFWTERWRRYPSPFEFEAGVRYDFRYLTTDSVRFSDKNRNFSFDNISATVGAIYHIGKMGKLTLNVGSAWRNPNANELLSLGVHHGAASFERGNLDLKAENALNTSLAFHFDHEVFELDASVFYNTISDFIYLQPDTNLNVSTGQRGVELTIRGAFPAFSYRQTDAILRGGDLSATFHVSKRLSWRIKGAVVLGENTLGERWTYQDSTDNVATEAHDRWLPLMPPNRVSNELRFELPDNQRFKHSFFSLNLISVSRQTRVAIFRDANKRDYPTAREFATPPAGYQRFDVSAGTTWHLGKQKIEGSLTVENLFDSRYRDYLNRLRFFADEIGRNFTLRLKTVF